MSLDKERVNRQVPASFPLVCDQPYSTALSFYLVFAQRVLHLALMKCVYVLLLLVISGCACNLEDLRHSPIKHTASFTAPYDHPGRLLRNSDSKMQPRST